MVQVNIDESRHGERGASLVEYALLVALIAVLAVGSIMAAGGAVNASFAAIAAAI